MNRFLKNRFNKASRFAAPATPSIPVLLTPDPANLSATMDGFGGLTITYSPNTDPNAVDFLFSLYMDPGFTSLYGSLQDPSGSVTFMSLSPGTDYYIRMVSVGALGQYSGNCDYIFNPIVY